MDFLSLETLTRSDRKRHFFSKDSFFREGKLALSSSGCDLSNFLFNTCFVVIKPEAIRGRQIAPLCAALSNLGFLYQHHRHVKFDHLLVHSLWRYQTALATDDRLRLQLGYRGVGTGLLVALSHCKIASFDAPLSVKFARAKGSAHASKRSPDSIRSLVPGPTALANFIHGPSEPADLVRELAIWVAPEMRTEFLHSAVSGPSKCLFESLEEAAKLLYEDTPEHDLNIFGAWQRIKPLLSSGGGTAKEFVDAVEAAISGNRPTNCSMNLGDLERLLGSSIKCIDPMDVYLLGSVVFPMDREIPDGCEILTDDLSSWG
jgi:hypothetical protein